MILLRRHRCIAIKFYCKNYNELNRQVENPFFEQTDIGHCVSAKKQTPCYVNYVEKYYGELQRRAQKQLKLCAKSCAEKELHELRVDIKKIHALLHFLSYCYGDISGKNKRLKKLFRRAGKIRNLQLMIHYLEKQMKTKRKQEKNLLRKLKLQLASRSERFIHRYRHHEQEAFQKTSQLIRECLKGKQKKETADYFRMMKEKISRAIHRSFQNEKQIHLLRKNIKTLKYNLCLARNIEAINLIDEKLLDKWEKLLGEWHDAVLLANRLDKIKTEMKLKSDLCSELENIRKAYLNKGNSLLKEFSRKQ